MTYIDVDRDPNTYNSSRAELRLPAGAKVSFARLYWGGNLRVGEQKAAEDNGRVLLAEQGGQYKEVLADTVGHRITGSTDGYAASADVTGIVRRSGSGAYTVAQLNVAKGHSAAGAWGGWSLVVAYEDQDEPLRRLAVHDGYLALHPERNRLSVRIRDLGIPARARGSVGLIAFNGDRGSGKDSVEVRANSRSAIRLHNAANPARDVMNSTISDKGRHTAGRRPAHTNTLGMDSDVFDLGAVLKSGADDLTFRFDSGSEGYQLGALFLQADARR